MMSPTSDVKTPEMATWIQEIVGSMLEEKVETLRQEMRENGLARLERNLNAHREYTEKRFDRLEAALAGLAEAQQQSEARGDRLEIALTELAEAQKRTEAKVEELAEAQKRTEAKVEELAEAQKRTEVRVGRLEIALTELAEAQKRTEARVGRLEIALNELAEAQKRTEARVGRLEIALNELAEAQKRTEARVERLEIALNELAEAQKRTEAYVAQLAATQQTILKRLDRLEHQVGQLGNALGIEVEGEAEDTVAFILEQQGYRLLQAPYALAMNGEIDIVIPVETPQGEQVSVLVEAKTRARLKELRRWHSRLQDESFQQQLVEAGVPKPFLPYFFGLRVYQTVDKEARRLGIGVLDPDGERVPAELLQ